MELKEAEKKQLLRLVGEWQANKKQELEATFGPNGNVNISTFYNVINRLQAKGFELVEQEDKLNIITFANNYRFTLSGSEDIRLYCKNNEFTDLEYSVMEKVTTIENSKQILEEYDVCVKVKSETLLDNTSKEVQKIVERWPVQKKAFRLIHRWSCIDEEERFRFDLSVVHQTSRKSNGEYNWQPTFTSENILKNPPVYEIEVELLRPKADSEEANTSNSSNQNKKTKNAESNSEANSKSEANKKIYLKNLIIGIGEVLRGIQKNTLLIRKSVFQSVKNEYKTLTKLDADIFRGVNPETLQVEHMLEKRAPKMPNIRDNFNVTDKADGLRVMIFTNSTGQVYLIDMSLNIYRTNLQSEACANTLLDAEWITKSRKGEQRQNVYAFDVYYGLGGKNVTGLPFVQSDPQKQNEDRQTHLGKWFEAWATSQKTNEVSSNQKQNVLSQFILGKKNFYHGEDYKEQGGIFKACELCLKSTSNSDYYTDGLILTSNDQPLPQKAFVTFNYQFKWKPSVDNTIDFLVKFEKDEQNNDAIVTLNNDEYKILRLFVAGSDDQIYKDPQGSILNGIEIPMTDSKKLKPVLFTPSDINDSMASVCYRKVYYRPGTNEPYVTCEIKEDVDENTNLVGADETNPDDIQSLGEVIQDGSIVEMRYDASRNPTMRWIPIRVRNDKTERFRSGHIKKTMNTDFVANSNWNSIYNPITLSMITTGSQMPLPEEIEAISSIKAEKIEAGRKYYDKNEVKNDKEIVKVLSEFHNHWVKLEVLLKPTLRPVPNQPKKTLIDIACGKAGDGFKWAEAEAGFVLGIDSAGDNITNKKDGAYRRYINFVRRLGGQENVPPMIFVIGDSSKRSFVDGNAGTTEDDKKILRALFAKKGDEIEPVPKLVNEWKGSLSKGADVISCMFAIHYFFKDKGTFDNLLNNIRESLKIGGYFIGCTFDGEAVYKFLKNKTEEVGKTQDEKIIWKLKKQYDIDDEVIPITEEKGFGLQLDVNFISIGLEHSEYLVPFKLLEAQMGTIGCRLLNDDELKEIGLSASTRLFGDELKLLEKRKKGKQYLLDGKDNPNGPIRKFSELNRWFIFKRVKESGEVKTPPKVLQATKETVLAKQESAAREEGIVPVPVPLAKVGPFDPTTKWNEDRLFIIDPSKQVSRKSIKKTYGVTNPFFALSLAYLFQIPDEDEPTMLYPSIEAYLAGRKFKKASTSKETAQRFSITGTMYGDYQTAAGNETDIEKLREKINAFDANIRNASQKGYDKALWDTIKEKEVQYALKYRFTNDPIMKSILAKIKTQNLYILYSAHNDTFFGGIYLPDTKLITGENIVGKYLMELGYIIPDPSAE